MGVWVYGCMNLRCKELSKGGNECQSLSKFRRDAFQSATCEPRWMSGQLSDMYLKRYGIQHQKPSIRSLKKTTFIVFWLGNWPFSQPTSQFLTASRMRNATFEKLPSTCVLQRRGTKFYEASHGSHAWLGGRLTRTSSK